MNTTLVWHELTHASHFQRMKNDKGLLWASDYWSRNVYQQARNDIATNSPYGSKGDNNWQIIALSEGWANYREEVLAQIYLKNPTYSSTSNSFLSNYVTMFKNLRNLGCSYSNLESSLSTNSITEYKKNLLAKYPYLSASITSIISEYE